MTTNKKTPQRDAMFGYQNRGCSFDDSQRDRPVQFLGAPEAPNQTDDGPDVVMPPQPPLSPPLRWTFEDISLTKRYCLKGGLVNWITHDGNEHIAGITADNHVIAFTLNTNGNWSAQDVTDVTGVKMVSDLAAWLTPNGQGYVEHLAGHTAKNELYVFWKSGGGDWNAVNVSKITGTETIGRMAAWVTQNGAYKVEHLGGRTPEGDVIVFWWSPLHDWQAVNVTDKTGKNANTDLVAWQTKNGRQTVEHLAGADEEQSLIVFWWSSSHDWQAMDLTAITNVRAVSASAAWQVATSQYQVEHLACEKPDGALAVFWWSPLHDWQAIDATRISGVSLNGRPSQYRSASLSGELLVGRDDNGRLASHWWDPARDWQALDISAIAGPKIASDPIGWLSLSGKTRKERIAAVGPSGELLVFEGSSTERDETDAVNAPIPGIDRKRRVRQKVLTIIWDPKKPGITVPSKQSVQNLMFGSGQSVRNYFLENSGGVFDIVNAGILGWYDADYSPSEYWPGGGVAGRDSGAEAIRKAATEIDFSAFDRSGDGTLTSDDVAILFILPGSGDGGGLGRIVGEDYQTRSEAQGITVDGVLIRWIAEVSLGNTPGIVSHELAHLIVGLGDMYFSEFINPYSAGEYSLMDNHWDSPHIDPANKLKLGWTKPRLLYRSGRYKSESVATSGKVQILHDPDRGTDEYFIIENRAGDGVFDGSIPDTGLGIWHVMDAPNIFNAAMPPPGVSQANWDTMDLSAAIGWSRKGVRMIRPEISGSSENRALWDGTDPATGYPLVSDDPLTSHAELKWGDGTPSPFSIRDVSAPGAVVEFTLDVAGAPAFSQPALHRVCSRPAKPKDGPSASPK